MPKFSIIVPVYNIEKYIKKCVDSILAQSFSDFELILVDDGSPDSCPQICDEYTKSDSRIKVIHKKNGGLSSARNAGLDIATGEFCWMVDGDDYISTDALEKIVPFANGDIDIINVGFVAFDDGNLADFSKKRTRYKFTGLADKKTICALAEQACSTRLLTFVWRNIYKTSFIKKNHLRFEEGLCYAEDSAFNMEAFMKADKIYFADVFVYAYCNRASSISKKITKNFDHSVIRHFGLYDKIRDENYKNFCTYPSEKYYEDAGIFTIKTLYVYALLHRLYCSSSKNNFFLFKKISKTDMIKKAFSRFDINKIKSKSLEWHMFNFVKHHMYFTAFIIYRFFIF
ncbi:MAG: glycosyltransferase [Clostridia bacterium]|nr:glycosyltransferase [Clostridia bacterium]